MKTSFYLRNNDTGAAIEMQPANNEGISLSNIMIRMRIAQGIPVIRKAKSHEVKVPVSALFYHAVST